MRDARFKNLSTPDTKIRLKDLSEDIVEIGDLMVGRVVHQPGWRWSTHMKPDIGGDWCRARHVGVILSGRMGVTFSDGVKVELEPNDVYDIAPGHDGYTLGDEPCVVLEWSGLRTFSGAMAHARVLASLMFTDIVGSTAVAGTLRDQPWRELLSTHYEAARGEIERFNGREVKTTGDGMLATFEGPAQAIHCAAAIRRIAEREQLRIRAGIHVGEVERVGADVRGVAVNEAARILGVARENEILVSEITRSLAQPAGLRFEDRGVHSLKGIPGDVRLFAYAALPGP